MAGPPRRPETARLREIEAALETTRNEHYASQDSFNVLQGEYYAAQSEVSRIEQALGHLRTTRERLTRQQGELETRNQSLNERIAAAFAEKENQAGKLANLADLLAQAEARLAAASQQHLPEKEEALRQAQQAVGEAQRALSNAEQNRQVDETHLAHAKKSLQQLEERKERLERELAQLPRPDAAKKTTEFYQEVCHILNVDPQKIVHVGDHYDFDYLVPRKLGIQAYYLDRSGERTGEFILRSLGELDQRLLVSTKHQAPNPK